MSRVEKSLRGSRGRIGGLTAKDMTILKAIRLHGPIDSKGLSRLTGYKVNGIMYCCWKLSAFGYLEFEERKVV